MTGEVEELGNQRFRGRIDRLIIEPDRVLAVDFKTNVRVPNSASEVPDGILRQLGVYRSILAQIYPDKAVEVAILWTRNRALMPIPHEIVRNVLRTTPAS